MSEGTFPSTLESNSKTGGFFRFTRFCSCNLIINVVLAVLILVSYLKSWQSFTKQTNQSCFYIYWIRNTPWILRKKSPISFILRFPNGLIIFCVPSFLIPLIHSFISYLIKKIFSWFTFIHYVTQFSPNPSLVLPLSPLEHNMPPSTTYSFFYMISMHEHKQNPMVFQWWTCYSLQELNLETVLQINTLIPTPTILQAANY